MTQTTARLGWIFWTTIVVLASVNTVQGQSVREIARQAFQSTVLLVMEDANGQALSLGSGFFVRPSEIASNLHVVEGAVSGYAKLLGQERKYDIEGVTAVDPERDLIILKVSRARASGLTLGDSDTLHVGDPVYALGNPRGLEGTFSQGIVSSVRRVRGHRLLQMTAPISPGSSGGPVLNGNSQVIGVSVATFGDGQNLNFAIPSNYLKTLLRKAKPTKPFALTTSAKTKRSILADLGGRGSEGVVGSHFSWNSIGFLGKYTFSVRNNLREPIRSVLCLVIFYAHDGLPIETDFVTIPGPIPGKLARRSPSMGRVETDQVRSLTAKTEIRVLDFKLVE